MMHSTVLRGSIRMRSGSLLLEAILAIGVFGLFLAAVGLTLLYGQENSISGGDRVRGISMAQEVLEASRSVRDVGFSPITVGQHGIALDANQRWSLSGTQSTRSGGYVVDVTVTSLGSDWVRLQARSRWKHGYTRSGSVLLTTELTDWRAAHPPGDWSSAVLEGSAVDAGTPLFNGVAVAGDYAYVTSETSGGGAGLYVFDISSMASPVRVASAFTLGAAGYGVAVKGKTLYVVTGDAGAEVRAYDVSSPTTLASGNLLASYNLSGSSLATSLALRGSLLYVGAQQDAAHDEFYVFNVGNTGAILYVNSLDQSADITGVALSGTAALLSTDDPVAELQVVSITSTGGLAFPVQGAYNLTDRSGGSLAIATTGTAALLGSEKGGIQEFVFFDTRSGGGNPPPSPGPWYHEGSGSLIGVAADPAACYAFLAADSGQKAFQIVDLRNTTLPELATYTSLSGAARGILYDPVRDRVFLLTRTALLLFRPASSSSSCG